MNPSSPAIDIQGFLFKCENAGGFDRWVRRWASLCDYCLYLYDKHGDRESKHAFLLPSVSVERCILSDTEGFPDRQQIIKIEEPRGKAVYLAAANAIEFEEWLNALQAAAQLRRVKRQDVEFFNNRNDSNNNNGLDDSMERNFRRQQLQRKIDEDLHHSSPNIHQPLDYNSRQLTPRQDGYMPRNEPLRGRDQYPVHSASMDPIVRGREMSPDDRMPPFNGSYRDLEYTDGPMRHSNPNLRYEEESPILPARSDGVRANPRPYLNQWPTGKLGIDTVKEDPSMLDTDVLATKPIEEIRRKYPVSGLAKRMSIAASDLLGKSHDELLISLIQLNREKANLERIRNYYILVLNHYRDEESENHLISRDPEHQDKVRRAMNELNDVEHQIELSQPLITFIDNIVKMGALYAGDDLMFATEYRRNLLSPQEYCPVKPGINFARRVQEKKIARDLTGQVSLLSERAPSGSGVYDMPTDGYLTTGTESAAYRKTREALEQELNELQSIYTTFHGKRNELSAYMKGLPADGGFGPEVDTTSSTLQRRQRRKSGGDVDAERENRIRRENTIKFPRRSTSRQPRSDATNSLRRRQSTSSAVMDDASRRNFTLPRNFGHRPADIAMQRSSTLPLANESMMASRLTNGQNGGARPMPAPRSQFEASYTGHRVQPGERDRDYRRPDGSGSLDRRHFGKDPRECISNTWDMTPSSETINPSMARGHFSAPQTLVAPREQESKANSKLSVQQQLDMLIGDTHTRRPTDSIRSSASEQPDRPLVRLTADRYKNGPSATTRLSASGPDNRERTLERLGRYYDSRDGAQPGVVAARSGAHGGQQRHEDDDPYERLSSVVSANRRLSEAQSSVNQPVNEAPAIPAVAPRTQRLPEQWNDHRGQGHSKMVGSNRGILEENRNRGRAEPSDQQFYKNKPNAPVDDEVFDTTTIDHALWTPEKVLITERYNPPSDSESDLLDEVERREKKEKISSIRKMLATHSLQTWTDSEIGNESKMETGISRKELEEEKDRRQHILELRQSLANEVKRKSKEAAKERRRTQEINYDHMSVSTN